MNSISYKGGVKVLMDKHTEVSQDCEVMLILAIENVVHLIKMGSMETLRY